VSSPSRQRPRVGHRFVAIHLGTLRAIEVGMSCVIQSLC